MWPVISADFEVGQREDQIRTACMADSIPRHTSWEPTVGTELVLRSDCTKFEVDHPSWQAGRKKEQNLLNSATGSAQRMKTRYKRNYMSKEMRIRRIYLEESRRFLGLKKKKCFLKEKSTIWVIFIPKLFKIKKCLEDRGQNDKVGLSRWLLKVGFTSALPV